MHRLIIRHGSGHGSDDRALARTVLPCPDGELIALVDVDPHSHGLSFDVVRGAAPILVLDERDVGPQRATLKPLGGVTTVLVTDDIAGLVDLVDRIVLVFAGHVIEAGTAAQVTHNPRHPLTRRLLAGARPPRVGGHHTGCPYVAHCPLGDDICDDHVPEPRVVADRRVACHYAELGPVGRHPART